MTNHLRLRRLAAAAAIATVLLTGACGGDDDDGGADDETTTTAAAAAAPNTVTIKDFKFSPLSAKGGSAITIKNDDAVNHTYSAVDGTFDAGTVAAGSTASLSLPAKAGEYDIKCNIHSSMSGKATVT